MPVLLPNTPPPPDYYADNLLRVVAQVAWQYNDLLNPPERALLQRIPRLSVPARRLYARLLTRRGPFVRIDRCVYAEVPNIGRAAGELRGAGLVLINHDVPADTLLAGQSITELLQFFPHIRADVRCRKPLLIEHIIGRYPDREIRRRLRGPSPWIEIVDRHLIDVLCVLFFGDTDHDLTTFVLEDLGVWRFEVYPLDAESRLFPNRTSLDAYIGLDGTRSVLERLEQRWNSDLAQTALEQLWHSHEHRSVERLRQKLLNRLGLMAERVYEHDLALACYAVSGHAPARERRVRTLARLGDLVGANHVLEEIRSNPFTRAELDFATRFAPDRARLTPPASGPRVDLLRLDAPPNERVESAVLGALLERGGLGAHLENQFPLAFFGLAFWDIVFAPVRGVFPNAYQLGPIDLFWPDFAAARATLIATRLNELSAPGVLRECVLSTWKRKAGVNNALVNWEVLTGELVERAIDVVPPGTWIRLFTHIANNLREARTGFPDLVLLYDDASFEFVEVKGPGDQLRPDQRSWLGVLQAASIPARVLKVAW